jgi:hypothetical protein
MEINEKTYLMSDMLKTRAILGPVKEQRMYQVIQKYEPARIVGAGLVPARKTYGHA